MTLQDNIYTTKNSNTFKETIHIHGSDGKSILADVNFCKRKEPQPVIIFVHGFKGFKDWGHFNLVAQKFIERGFVFIKFNFSHNGTTLQQPLDFADLEAFGNNNFGKELFDLEQVLQWTVSEAELIAPVDTENIYLIGHSRGGGIVILKAAEDERISKVVTWAAVSDFRSRLEVASVEQWKKEGVIYILNSRTNQQMPMYYQMREDFIRNSDRYNIEVATKKMKKEMLIIHGSNDASVSVNEAHMLKLWKPDSKLVIIDGADHTFGATHPYSATDFTPPFNEVFTATIKFLKD